MSIYDLNIRKQNGEEISMKEYEGKVLLIVNTATGCGFTPQYQDLQALYEAHAADGLEILDFPCNQFGNQAPGTDEEIYDFCTGRFGITFPQFAKVDVNGEQAAPVFQWLVKSSSFEGFGMSPQGLAMSALLKKLDRDYQSNSSIKWNFTKFLIDREGRLVGRFEPTISMKKVAQKVKEIL